jgi:adenylyltransferase/sulfurtransferase
MEQGKVPTTPTTSSVIAGIQVQEALKMLHGLDSLAGRGFVFDGTSHQSYVVTYARLEDCPSHDAIEPIVSVPARAAELTVGELLERVCADLGATAVVEFNHDLLESLTCTPCNKTYPLLASLGKVTQSQGECPNCGEPCTPNLYHSIGADSPLLGHTLAELGVPAWDILVGRAGNRQQGYELTGDREQVLGPLATGPLAAGGEQRCAASTSANYRRTICPRTDSPPARGRIFACSWRRKCIAAPGNTQKRT